MFSTVNFDLSTPLDFIDIIKYVFIKFQESLCQGTLDLFKTLSKSADCGAMKK